MEREAGRKRERRHERRAGPMRLARRLSWPSVPCCRPPKGGAGGAVHCADQCEEGGQGRGGLGSEVLAAVADDVKPAVRRGSLPRQTAAERRGSRDGSRRGYGGAGAAAAGTHYPGGGWWGKGHRYRGSRVQAAAFCRACRSSTRATYGSDVGGTAEVLSLSATMIS